MGNLPSLELRPEPASPGKARAFIRSLLVEWAVVGVVADDAELLVSELVTNAVIHARTGVTVDVVRHYRSIEFVVSDGSTREVQLCRPSAESVTGRGIYFLDQLAADWEVVPRVDGKEVRFSLPVDATTAVSTGVSR